MKIGLKSAFPEIESFTARSQRSAAFPQEFDKTLGELLSPKSNILSNSGELPNSINSSESKASLQIAPPQLMMPSLNPIVPEIKEDIIVPPENGLGDVKTPTGLSVRKISADDSTWQKASYTERKEKVSAMMKEIGSQFGVDPALGVAVASIESGFDTTAISRDGHFSKGLMQLLDGTGKELKEQVGIEGSYQPYDPKQNVTLGVSYLRRLHDLFSFQSSLSNKLTTHQAVNISSKEKLAVAAYNAGEGRVAAAQEKALKLGKNPGEFEQVEPYLPEITQNYVKKVISAKDKLASDWS